MATQQDPTRDVAKVIERLAAFEPGDQPVLSLYLDTRANQHGREGAELADTLVRLAEQTDAAVKLIEDPALLEAVGGAAAALRYRLDRSNAHAEQQGER